MKAKLCSLTVLVTNLVLAKSLWICPVLPQNYYWSHASSSHLAVLSYPFSPLSHSPLMGAMTNLRPPSMSEIDRMIETVYYGHAIY
uniref:Uncharacterized protein n=1 Tax=Setaria viridis TaxID=4556 RepID=A0A4U6VUP9_SETVI|nr:hypothetical protein SEVIR_2G249850v2 [Setaria viridis]